MAGFQQNLTPTTAPSAGSVPSAGTIPRAPSTAQSIAAGVGQLFDLGTKAAPLIDKYMTDKQVEGYSQEFRSLTQAKEQGMTDSQYNVRRRELELRVTANTDTATQQLIKQDVGLSQFSIDVEGAKQAERNMAIQNIGKQLGFTGEEAFTEGAKVLAVREKLNQDIINYETKAKAQKLSQAEDNSTAYAIHKASVSGTFSSLSKKTLLPISSGAINLSSLTGQKHITEMALGIDALADTETIRITQELSDSGKSASFIAGAIKGATEDYRALAGLLNSKVESSQKAGIAMLKAANTELGIKLIEMGGVAALAQSSPQVMAVLMERLVQANPNTIDKIVPNLLKVSETPDDLTKPLADPLSGVRSFLQITKDPNVIGNEKDDGKRYQLTDGASAVVTNIQKDFIVGADEAQEYQKVFLNLMDGVTKSARPRNQSKWLYSAQTEAHKAYLRELPADQRTAVAKKTSDAAIYTSRQAISEIGIPNLIEFDTASNQFILNSEVYEESRARAAELSPGISGVITLLGSSPQAKAQEAAKASDAVKIMNQALSITIDNSKHQPTFGKFSDSQVGYLMAQSLQNAGSAALSINGTVEFKGIEEEAARRNITPADLINDAKSSIAREIAERTGSPRPKQTQPQGKLKANEIETEPLGPPTLDEQGNVLKKDNKIVIKWTGVPYGE